MAWNFIQHNLKTNELDWIGSNTSIKGYLQYIPEILDYSLKELGCGIDERDDLIADFMCGKGKKPIFYKDYAFYLDKNVFDCYGHIKPNYTIRKFENRG